MVLSILYNKNLSWGTMLGETVVNVFPFPAKYRQAILSHMLADHITSTMHKLDFWTDVKIEKEEKEEGQEKRKWKQTLEMIQKYKKKNQVCILLYFPWAVRFKASRNKHFLEALFLLLSLPKQMFIFLEGDCWSESNSPFLFLTHHPALQFNLLTPTPSRFLHFQSINHEKSHAVILCFSHS